MPLTILLAEDHDTNREMLSLRLKRLGHAVIEATNGAEAVAHTQSYAPDLIIMDLSMPVMDGIEAWRMICELMDAPPPAIALTAVAIQDVRLTCQEIGFRAFLTKPTDFAALTALLDQVRAEKRAAA